MHTLEELLARSITRRRNMDMHIIHILVVASMLVVEYSYTYCPLTCFKDEGLSQLGMQFAWCVIEGTDLRRARMHEARPKSHNP